ncbi:unnamed protein product [Ophioblennius macclurei]
MDKRRLEMFRNELENLNCSDYNGLESPGLTCYLNSVLQVLFMTRDFRDAVKRSGSDYTATIDSDLAALFNDLQKKVTRTRNMVAKLGITDVYEQRDAAEYLETILCRTSPEASKVFHGELSHKITCLKCDDENQSHSKFWTLPIQMDDLDHNTYHVEEGLKAFFQTQKFSDDNQLYCTRCEKKEDARIKCKLTKAPVVLTLLLKRFAFDYRRRRYVKLQCSADVPKTLCMEECRYELYALVRHYGSLTGGHYTADIKSFETGEWYCFNDSVVRMLKAQPFGAGQSSLRSSSAYLLLYRKVKECENADGSDLEYRCSQSNAEDEGRLDGSVRGQSLKPSYQSSVKMSCESPPNPQPANMFDPPRGASTTTVMLQKENRERVRTKTDRQKTETKDICAKRQTSESLRKDKKCESGPKKPWK